MTPFERSHPKTINGSRRQRIARGSGMQVTDVNQLLERFGQAQKMMKSLARGGGAGIPGMPGLPGARKGKSAPQRKKAKSGNPAKRAAEERALADRAVAARQDAAGHAFGMPPAGSTESGAPGVPGGQPGGLDPAALPKGFEDFLR